MLRTLTEIVDSMQQQMKILRKNQKEMNKDEE